MWDYVSPKPFRERHRDIFDVFVVLSDKVLMQYAYVVTGKNAGVFFLGDGSHTEITVRQPVWQGAAGPLDEPPQR